MAGRVRVADWALVAAWPVALGVGVALNIAQLGPVDEWGEYPAAITMGLLVGAALMTTGLVSVGLRVLSEKPVRAAQELVQA